MMRKRLQKSLKSRLTSRYLMYTTVGRADLIAFEVSAIKGGKTYDVID